MLMNVINEAYKLSLKSLYFFSPLLQRHALNKLQMVAVTVFYNKATIV